MHATTESCGVVERADRQFLEKEQSRHLGGWIRIEKNAPGCEREEELWRIDSSTIKK